MSQLLQIEEPLSARSAAPSLRAFLEMGFRPLYPLTCAWAALSVALWIFAPAALQGLMTGVLWHAHEMLWGFVMAIAVGFLLTAGANWTGINPLHGRPLGVLVAVWALARIGFLVPGAAAFVLASAAQLLFYLAATLALARVVRRARSTRNYGVPVLLLGMCLSNGAYLWGVWRQLDYTLLMQYLYSGLLCMALVAILVGRRVIPFFASRAVPGLVIPMHLQSGRLQLLLGSLAIGFVLLDAVGLGAVAPLLAWSDIAAALILITGAIALWQVLAWRPLAVRHQPLLWILYAGYAGLGTGLIVASAQLLAPHANHFMRLAWPAHVLGMAGFATLIIGMVTRTALGHLGRALATDRSMLASYILMLLAALLRLLALLPTSAALPLQHASATAWIVALALYLWRFVPWLIRPRADQPGGKPVVLAQGIRIAKGR